MLSYITLHMARGREFPQGSTRHGYELTAPLDRDGHLDPAEWRERKGQCVVRRFWGDEPDRYGRLVHRSGGVGGATWLIDYDQTTDDDDEAGFRLGEHVFRVGEYVSIRDDDEEMHTFRVAAIRAVSPSGNDRAA